MRERLRDALGAIDRVEPDRGHLRDLAAGGPRMSDPMGGGGRRVVALVVGLALAGASIALVVTTFRRDATAPTGPTPSAAASPSTAIDRATVCAAPLYDPDVALLVGNETVEYPRAVLEGPGSDPDDLEGPAADALRAHLATPALVHAPEGGWRAIAESGERVTYAAPADIGDLDWWVVDLVRRGDGWRAGEEIVEQRPTPAQLGLGLRLEWTGQVVVEDGGWTSTLRVVNEREEAWTWDHFGLWGLVHVFDPDTGKELADGSGIFPVGEASFAVEPGMAAELPLALGGVATGLPPGSHDIVACVPQLALASPVSTLRVVDGPAEVAGVDLLTYTHTGGGMDALARGRLTVDNGCLAIDSGGRSTYVVWPEGYALVDRGGRTVLIDPVGREVAGLGEDVSLGGGFLSARHIEGSVHGGLPDPCRVGGEGYFLAWAFPDLG